MVELESLMAKLEQMEHRGSPGVGRRQRLWAGAYWRLRFINRDADSSWWIFGWRCGRAVWPAGLGDQMHQAAKQSDWRPRCLPRSRAGCELGRNRKLISRFIGRRSFDELKIPFAATACDFRTGELVVLNEGDVAHAVRISCTLPGIYYPVEYQGRLLVDGGLVQNLPAGVCRSLGAEYVIGVDLHANLAAWKPRTVVRSVIHAAHILQRQHELVQLEQVDVAVQPKLGMMSPINFRPVDEYVDLGYQAAREAADELKSMLMGIVSE